MLPLPTSKKRREFWVRIPLGVWLGKQYHLHRLEETTGWHYWCLLVTLDSPVRGLKGWRLQWQRQGIELTRTTRL
jgi:hypothetical protein